MFQLRLVQLLLVALVFVLRVGVAWGSVIEVDPVKVHLSKAKRSESLRLTNNGSETARFQVVAYTWQQSSDGEMQLGPTKDLLFFPSLLQLKPGETRQIRVASKVAPGSIERSYRLFIEELPPAVRIPGQVRVLTRLGLPIFVQPHTVRSRPSVKASARAGTLRVSVLNSGNAYFMGRSVRVVARSKSGNVIFERTLPAWYVLAGGHREYELDLNTGACEQLASIDVSLFTEAGRFSRRIKVSPEHTCRP